MIIYENCIDKANMDAKKIKSIARRFQNIADECRSLGIQIFGGSAGDLRFNDDPGNIDNQQLILAHIVGDFSGGDGACHEDEEGFMRGE